MKPRSVLLLSRSFSVGAAFPSPVQLILNVGLSISPYGFLYGLVILCVHG